LIVVLHRAKQRALPVALVAGGLPLLPDLTGEAKSYAERGFEFRAIGALDRSAAAAALEEPARSQNVRWEPAAIERVVDLTEGYPYFLQEYGSEIWKVHHGPVISSQRVSAAEPIVLEYLDDNFFSQRIGKLPDAERRYMSAMASLGDGPQRSGDVAGAMGKDPQDVSVARDRLIKASLLYAPRRGEVDFTVPYARTTSAGIHTRPASRYLTNCAKRRYRRLRRPHHGRRSVAAFCKSGPGRFTGYPRLSGESLSFRQMKP
jgi:hypothetical protein